MLTRYDPTNQVAKESVFMKVFRRYFPQWIEPLQEVRISISDKDQENKGEIQWQVITRVNAVFRIKKDLLALWSYVVSSRLLEELLQVTPEEVKLYYQNKKISHKVKELFGTREHVSNDDDNLRCYYSYLTKRIDGNKFKLPLSYKEL